MSLPLVKIENASAFYPGRLPRKSILENIDWQITQGGHCALFGSNGAGKSSLLKLIHGDLWASSGSIKWLGPAGYSDSPITAREVTGLVSPQIQANCQFNGWHVTARDIVAGAKSDSPYSFAASEADWAEAESLMAELGASNYLKLYLAELSQGQLRLILLAREILRKPDLLLLDEWSEGLDQSKQKLVLNKLEALAPETTMIFAVHRQECLPDWVREQKYIEAGKFTAKPNFTQLSAHVAQPLHKEAAEKGRLIFDLKNVSVYLDSQCVLHDINWQMREGENWQICGPNGSGKSTFLRLLAGDEFIYAGGSLKFWLKGADKPVETLAEKRGAISLVSDLSQALYGYNLTALELILSGIDNTIGLHRDYDEEEREWGAGLLAEFFREEGSAIANQSIRRLSTGQLRRLFLARALAAKPEIILLDEPLSNLDWEAERRYFDLLTRLVDKGVYGFEPQIVIVSHQSLPEICNRRATMSEGHLD